MINGINWTAFEDRKFEINFQLMEGRNVYFLLSLDRNHIPRNTNVNIERYKKNFSYIGTGYFKSLNHENSAELYDLLTKIFYIFPTKFPSFKVNLPL